MKPDAIIIHCAATRVNSHCPVETINAWHKDRNFKRSAESVKRAYKTHGLHVIITNPALQYIGYHYYIRKNGDIYCGRHEDEVGAHCLGYNNHSIGICYEGGLDENGKAKDTRTPQQKVAIDALVKDIYRRYEIREIMGHRDTSPDKNGNGIVDPFERLKDCPCYDVIPEYYNFILPEVIVTPKK